MSEPKMNVEAFAFTYLMAETEAIMKHYQGDWITEDPWGMECCETAGCLAGHACVYDTNSVEDAKKVKWVETAIKTLWQTEKDNLPRRVLEDLYITSVKEVFGETIFNQTDGVGVFDVMDEEAALDRFREHVHKFGTQEEIKRFEDLISLDVEALLEEINVESIATKA